MSHNIVHTNSPVSFADKASAALKRKGPENACDDSPTDKRIKIVPESETHANYPQPIDVNVALHEKAVVSQHSQSDQAESSGASSNGVAKIDQESNSEEAAAEISPGTESHMAEPGAHTNHLQHIKVDQVKLRSESEKPEQQSNGADTESDHQVNSTSGFESDRYQTVTQTPLSQTARVQKITQIQTLNLSQTRAKQMRMTIQILVCQTSKTTNRPLSVVLFRIKFLPRALLRKH